MSREDTAQEIHKPVPEHGEGDEHHPHPNPHPRPVHPPRPHGN